MITEELAEQMKNEYVLNNISFAKLATKYGVEKTAIFRLAKKECWQAMKRNATAVQSNPNESPLVLKAQEEAAERLLRMTDKLSAKVEQLLDLDEPLAPRDVKSVSGAMLDIKMLYGLKTPEERREQEARIRTLEKGLEDNQNKDNTVKVEFVNLEEIGN